MKSLNKPVMLAMFAVFGAALAVGTAHAQEHMAVDVPFNFVLGKVTLHPAAGRSRWFRDLRGS